MRADQSAGDQLLLARRDGGNALLLGLAQGLPFVEVNGQRVQATQALAAGQWQHLALSADGSALRLCVNGRESGSLALSLPAFASVIAIGADLPKARPCPWKAPPKPGASRLRCLRRGHRRTAPVQVARPAALILADATAQGAESRLVAYGVDEEQSGFGFGSLGFLLKAVPVDAWVIIAVLVLMMIQSWVIMIRKSRSVARVMRANQLFREQFARVGTRLELLADDRALNESLVHSSLWRLYQVAVKEIRTRRDQGADTSSISAATIEAIRASMDGVRTRENQQLSSRLSTLSMPSPAAPTSACSAPCWASWWCSSAPPWRAM